MASIDPDLTRGYLAEFLAKEVERLGLGVALIGGEGVNFWALPRYTEDFDLTVAARPDAVRELVFALKDRGYVVVREEDADSTSGPAFTRLVHAEGLPAIDLIGAKTAYQDLVIARAIPAQPGVLPVATPEDLIVLKLIANRSIDQRDIVTLVEAQSIDWDYVEHWADIWQVSDALRRLLRELE